MRRSLASLLAGSLALAGSWSSATALETDQFFAWGRPLEDATDIVNAKVNAEILLLLEEINRKDGPGRPGCRQVMSRVKARMVTFIFHDLEIWMMNSSLVPRIPGTPGEQLEYRERSLFHRHGPFDVSTALPWTPTIEVAGVRLGTDKLSHFFSEGWWYYRSYRQGRAKGLSREEAEVFAIRRGFLMERTILGLAVSGVLSLADLEADFRGMRFYADLCEGERPTLTLGPDGWRLRRAFDLRDHVTPEWDESYQPAVYSERRWRKVRPVLERYCPVLSQPEVASHREAYRARDRLTPVERWVRERVEAGKLADPGPFGIDAVCEAKEPSTLAPGASRAP